MAIRLDIRREDGWQELGIYPNRCSAEIAADAHYKTLRLRGASYRFVDVAHLATSAAIADSYAGKTEDVNSVYGMFADAKEQPKG